MFEKKQGTRLEVWKGIAEKAGTLRKQDLIKNKWGRLVSKKKSEAAAKNYKNNKNLQDAFKKNAKGGKSEKKKDEKKTSKKA